MKELSHSVSINAEKATVVVTANFDAADAADAARLHSAIAALCQQYFTKKQTNTVQARWPIGLPKMLTGN